MPRAITSILGLTLAMMTLKAQAATVLLEVIHTGPGEAVVAPGDAVPYAIRATLTSDNPGAPDHDGLAFLTVSLQTNLGVVQTQAELAESFQAAFPVAASAGTPSEDDLIQIGGGQNTLGNVQRGLGSGEPLVIATGSFTTPDTEGTFTITFDTGRNAASANVLRPDGSNLVSAATISLAAPLTIQTSSAVAPRDEPDDDNDGDDAEGGNDPGDAVSLPCAPGATGAAGLAFMILVGVRLCANRSLYRNGEAKRPRAAKGQLSMLPLRRCSRH